MIVVVGAGISGLALAHHLDAHGVDFTLLEASGRAGGVIRSGRVEGHLLEWGPQRARLTRDFTALVDELGLRERLVLAPPDLPLYVYRAGRLRRVPFSPAALLFGDALSVAGRVRVLAEPLTAGARDDESVADFFTRKVGREAYETLAGPLYGGLYASDPADMTVGLSLGHALREFGVGRSLLLRLLRRGGTVRTPAACTFEGGLEELPRALLERHRAHVRLGTRVERIERSGTGWRVAIAEADPVDAERVVLCAPAGATSALLRDAAPDAAARIGRLRYNPLGVVHLHAPNTGLRGLGYQVSFAEPLVTRGVTWNDALFGRNGVYTVYLGGAKNPWVADAPEERLAEIAAREFRTVTGHDARALAVEREWMPAWDRSWSATRDLALPPGLHVHANWASRPGIPGRLAGARSLAAELAAAQPARS